MIKATRLVCSHLPLSLLVPLLPPELLIIECSVSLLLNLQSLLAVSVRFLGWLTLWLASATFLQAISDLVFPLGCLVDMSNLTCQTESHWLILKISRIWLFTTICTAACAIWFTIMSGVDYFSNSYSSPYFHFCLQRAYFPHITLSDPINNLDLISLFSDFPNGSFFFSE